MEEDGSSKFISLAGTETGNFTDSIKKKKRFFFFSLETMVHWQ